MPYFKAKIIELCKIAKSKSTIHVTMPLPVKALDYDKILLTLLILMFPYMNQGNHTFLYEVCYHQFIFVFSRRVGNH